MSNILSEIIETSCEIWFKTKQLHYAINILKDIYIVSSDDTIDSWNIFSPYISDFFNYISMGKVVMAFCFFNKYNNQIWNRYVAIIDLMFAFNHSKNYNIIQNYEVFFEQLCEQLQYIEFAIEPFNQI